MAARRAVAAACQSPSRGCGDAAEKWADDGADEGVDAPAVDAEDGAVSTDEVPVGVAAAKPNFDEEAT